MGPRVEIAVEFDPVVIDGIGTITIGQHTFTLDITPADLEITVDPKSSSVAFKKKGFEAKKYWNLPKEVQDQKLSSASASASFNIGMAGWKAIPNSNFEARATASGTATASVKKGWVSGWYVEASIKGTTDIEVRKKQEPPDDLVGLVISLSLSVIPLLLPGPVRVALHLQIF